MKNEKLKIMMRVIMTLFIIHYSLFIYSQRSKEIYIQVIDTAGLAASVVADTSWILGQLDIVRAELADTSEAIQSIIDQQRRLYFAPYYLGQDTLGGIIYHLELDANGEVHGLIACPQVQHDSTYVSWAAYWYYIAKFELTQITNYTMSINDGASNTASLIANASNTAAIYCDTLTYGGFTDWYLPSMIELKLLGTNIKYIPDITTTTNWFEYMKPKAGFEDGMTVNFIRDFHTSSRGSVVLDQFGPTIRKVFNVKVAPGEVIETTAAYAQQLWTIPIRKF